MTDLKDGSGEHFKKSCLVFRVRVLDLVFNSALSDVNLIDREIQQIGDSSRIKADDTVGIDGIIHFLRFYFTAKGGHQAVKIFIQDKFKFPDAVFVTSYLVYHSHYPTVHFLLRISPVLIQQVIITEQSQAFKLFLIKFNIFSLQRRHCICVSLKSLQLA